MVDPSGHDGLLDILLSVGLTSLIAGSFGGVLGGAAHGLKGAVAGFAGSFSGTAISLAAIPVFAFTGPLDPFLAFGIGNAAGTVIQKVILDGTKTLEDHNTWVEVIVSFLTGGGLGVYGGDSTQYLTMETEKTLSKVPYVWDVLGNIENGTGVLPSSVAESGLTQDYPTIISKFAPKFVSIIKELATEDISDTVEEKVIAPLVQTFVMLIDDLFFKPPPP